MKLLGKTSKWGDLVVSWSISVLQLNNNNPEVVGMTWVVGTCIYCDSFKQQCYYIRDARNTSTRVVIARRWRRFDERRSSLKSSRWLVDWGWWNWKVLIFDWLMIFSCSSAQGRTMSISSRTQKRPFLSVKFWSKRIVASTNLWTPKISRVI